MRARRSLPRRSVAWPRQARAGARAFSLLEISIALLLLGLMMAVAVPGINALSGADLKKSSGMMQGLLRDTYARSAISGHTHRVVLDLELHAYWVEVTEGGIVLPREKQEADKEGKAVLDQLDERIERIQQDTRDEQDQEKLKLYRPPSFAPVPFPGQDRDDEVKPQRLPSDVRFKSVWADHLEKPAIGGQVAIYFFPGGYTQEVIITLTDDDLGERTLSLVTNPLTGEVYIDREVPEVPKAW
jgi:type II secretory pathway pseudopilin PulG